MLFPTTFISTSEKIGVGLEKQAAIFCFSFTRRWVVRYSCFDFFSSAVWSYFQLSGLWNTYLPYQIRHTATYIYVEMHKMLNFQSICSGDWNICAKYDLQGQLPLTGALTLIGTRKPTVRCLITRPDYHLWEHKLLSEYPAFENMQISDQTCFKIFHLHRNIFHLHINNQTPWKVLQMRQHGLTGFWYAMFVYIWSSQLSKIIQKFHYTAIKIALCRIGFFVPVRVNALVRGSRPRKS